MTSCERHCTTYVDSQLLCINALGEDMTHCFQIFSVQVAHVNHYAISFDQVINHEYLVSQHQPHEDLHSRRSLDLPYSNEVLLYMGCFSNEFVC
jgi:hypothetical protein